MQATPQDLTQSSPALADTMPSTTRSVDFRGLIQWVEYVAGSVSVVTALLVFFGHTRSNAYFGYFGIDQEMLDFTLQDDVLRSADSTFGFAVRALALILVLLAVERLLSRWLRVGPTDYTIDSSSDGNGRSSRQRVRAGLVFIGYTLICMGLLSTLGVLQPVTVRLPEQAAAATLVLGSIVVMRFGLQAQRTSGDPAARAAHEVADFDRASADGKVGSASSGRGRPIAICLLLLASFWACTLYASESGEEIARQVDSTPAHLPLVTVFSKEHLDLPGRLVDMRKVPLPGGELSYRYTGLRLLAYSKDRWFLLTGRYSDGYRSSAVILRDSETLRVEVARQRDIGR